MHAGDAAKFVIIVLCLGYLGLIAADQTLDSWTFFSPSYLKDGFCVSNKAGHWLLHGQFLCFYADATMALMMAGLVHIGRNPGVGLSEPALTPIAKNMVSLFGHGCGHLFLGISVTYGEGSSAVFENLTFSGQLAAFVFLFPVWYMFMRDKRRSVATTCAYALGHNTLQVFFLPTHFFFTHVLMGVLLGSALRWLGR
jgi:hypothetical protein